MAFENDFFSAKSVTSNGDLGLDLASEHFQESHQEKFSRRVFQRAFLGMRNLQRAFLGIRDLSDLPAGHVPSAFFMAQIFNILRPL